MPKCRRSRLSMAPITRSSSRPLPRNVATSPKRKASSGNPASIRSKKSRVDRSPSPKPQVAVAQTGAEKLSEALPITMTLSFSLAAAKKHLVAADGRFADLFHKLACKPFELLEPVHPFRLASIVLLLPSHILTYPTQRTRHFYLVSPFSFNNKLRSIANALQSPTNFLRRRTRGRPPFLAVV